MGAIIGWEPVGGDHSWSGRQLVGTIIVWVDNLWERQLVGKTFSEEDSWLVGNLRGKTVGEEFSNAFVKT